MSDPRDPIQVVREVLERYTFTPANEERLQAQVAKILHEAEDIRVLGREVIAKGGRYDVLVEVGDPHLPPELKSRVVLELKMRGPAAAVERQAQRYALTGDIDAVAIVTTSSQLRSALVSQPPTLGGKPFGVIYLRPF